MTKVDKPNSYRNGPDERGHFGIFGGRFVAETLMPLVLSLEEAYKAAKADPSFQGELDHFLEHFHVRLLGVVSFRVASQVGLKVADERLVVRRLDLDDIFRLVHGRRRGRSQKPDHDQRTQGRG